MCGFSAVFAWYYPPVPSIEDEVGFINQALVWSRGSLSAEGAGWPDLADFAPVGGRHVGTRHPGRSLVAVPFLAIGGGRAVFASGLMLHLLGTALAGGLLVRLGRSPLWAALVLFHPTLAIYSRTVMADGAAGAALLLAAWATTVAGARGAVWAGLATGLAALMRYHAALALPIIAGSIGFERDRARPRRDAWLCLLAGCAVGVSIVAYNLVAFQSPFGLVKERGFFSLNFLIPNGLFYAGSLMIVWPGLLLAPLFDRSPIRWLVRGVTGFFLLFFSLYYFHDQAPRWLETAIVGQRLLQVALPLWIVSYAGVLDDRIVAPSRRRLPRAVLPALVALGCLGLLALNGLAFARHQRHLGELREARDALAANVPEGSLVVYRGSVPKLVGVPLGVPSYRLRRLEFQGKPSEEPGVLFHDLDSAAAPWYLADLGKSPGEPLSDYARSVIARYRLEPVPVSSSVLSIFVRRAP